MTTTSIVYQILASHHELTAGAIHKKCAGMPGIANMKSVSNALTRLKKDGRVESVYDDDKGLWLWHIVRESPVASSECAMRIGSAMAAPPEDHSSHTEEMASDITEINHESIVETREPDADENADDASQTAAADAVQVSDPAKAETGRAPKAVADSSNVLGISVQAGNEAQTPKPATPIPVGEAIAEYASYRWGEKESYLEGFLYGISFAERYHGIFDAD